MSATAPDIESIIRVVLQRLAAARDSEQGSAAASLKSDVSQIASSHSDSHSDPTELQLRERLITLQTVESQLAGKKSVRVHARAVVTPAVVDLLRAKRIALHRDSQASKANRGANDAQTRHVVPVHVCGSAIWFKSLAKHLCPKQATVDECDDAQAIGSIETQLQKGVRQSLWLSANPYASALAAQKYLALAVCCWPQLWNGKAR